MKKILTAILVFSSMLAGAQTTNYTALNGPFGGTVSDIIKLNSGNLLASGANTLYQSTDAGATWTKLATAPSDYINDLEYDATNNKIYALTGNRLYSSSDNGATWLTLATSAFSSAQKIRRSPTGNFLYIYTYSIGGNYKVFRSAAGTAWAEVFSTPSFIEDLDVNGGGRVFVSTSGNGVWRSDGSGLNFAQLTISAGGVTETVFTSFAVSSTGALFAMGSSIGPCLSTNNGDTWTSLKANIVPTPTTFDGHLEADASGNIYLLNNFNTQKLYSTSNNGTTWSTINLPSFPAPNSYIYSDFLTVLSTSSFIINLSNLGLYKTIDTGTNWFRASNGITAMQPRNITMANNGNLLYAYGYPAGFFLSIDDGATFDHVMSANTSRLVNGFFKASNGDLYGYGNGVIRSTDNGLNWSVRNSTQFLDQAVFQDVNNFFGYSSNYFDGTNWQYVFSLLKSTDQGATWTRTTITGIPSSNQAYLPFYDNMAIDGSGNGYLYLYSYASSKYELYKINLTTAAATAMNSSLPGNPTIYSFAVTGNTIFVSGYDGGNKFYTSTNGGSTWTVQAAPTAAKLIAISTTTIYLSAYNNLYISTDAGASWASTGNFGTNNQVQDVLISPTNYSYVVPNNFPAYKSNSPVIPPAAPTSLVVKGFSEDDVLLAWNDNSNNEDYFIIERSTNNGVSFDSLTRVTRPNGYVQLFAYAELGNMDAGATYKFRVRAKGAGGKSAYTNEVTATLLADGKATSNIPLNHSWTATTSNESGVGVKTYGEVSIQRYLNTAGYYVISNLNVGSATPIHSDAEVYIVENGGNVLMYEGEDIQRANGTWNATTKTLTIQWQTNNFYAARSETTTFVMNSVDPPPVAASNVGAYIKTSSEVVVTWTAGNFAQSFQVQRSTTPGTGFVNVGSVVNYPTSLAIDNATFVPGTTYYYRVVSTGSGGSTNSAEYSFTYQTPLFEAKTLVGADVGTQGVAWTDFDNDGDDDLIMAPLATGTSIFTFENQGNGELALTTLTNVAGFTAQGFRNVVAGDINNDDRTDFIVNGTSPDGISPVGGDQFINNGSKTFTRTTIQAPNTSAFNWYAQLADVNNDGRLDEVFEDNPNTTTTKHNIYLQNGDGTFALYELGEIAADGTVSRGGSFADFDNDGDQDYLRTAYGNTAPDFDQLYKNNGDGTFSKVTGTAFEAEYLMRPRTISWADFDNDLDLDVFIGHNAGSVHNMLYQNNGNGTFTALTAALPSEAKTAATNTFGSAWGDIDNDGDQDLIVANTTAVIYLNNGTGGFTKYVGAEYIVAPDANRTNIAFAFSDYDKNGTLDFATSKGLTTGNFPTIVLKNTMTVGTSTKWLEIKLKGTVSNRSGIGARIVITTPDTKKQMRVISSLTGYAASSSLVAHFGLKAQTSASVTVYWPSGIVQTLTNVTANQMITITEDAAGPQILSRTPDVSSTNIAANTTVSFTLNEPSTPQATKYLLLYAGSDLSTPLTGVEVTAAAKSGDTYTFTLPLKLVASTQYNISVDAGAFKDAYGNPSLEFPTGLWSFTVSPAPAVTALSPNHNATSVAVNTPLQITFDKTIAAVAGKRLKVLDGATTLVDIDVSTNGTINNSSYSFTPANPLPYERLLRVTIDPGAFVDANKQTDIAGITNEWSFTTVLPPDTQKPVISFDNAQIPDPLEKNFATIAFGITVTDNRTVASATLRHRKTGEKDFATTALTLNNANGKWEGSIPNSFVSDMGFEYFFEAADNATPAANTARLPLDATTYFKSKTSFKNSPPSLTLPSAGTKNSWKIIAVPYVFENGNNSAATLFSSLGSPDKTKWRLLIYQSNPDAWNENIASIERGKGYFINTAISGASVSLAGAIAPPETRDNLFTMNLQAGWNQIGNPYTVTISLADVKNYNTGLANAQFVTYANGSYSTVTQLAPFEGGFVNVPAATTIKIPFTGQTLSGGRRGSDDLGDDIDSEEWRVKINLSQGASTFDLGFIGMALDADPNLDAYDMVKPPRFFDFIDMSVAHPEHVSKKFSGDVVPTAPAHTWDFNVDSNLDGMAEMTWDQQKLQDARRELFLLDVARQVLVDMKKVGSYAFNPKESSSFRLYFGEDLKIAPERILLGKAFPNPTAGVTTIGFSLPETGGRDQSVSLDVIDQMGRTLGTIVRGRFNPGFNEASFEANTLPNGFYTYRLTVQNSQGRQVLVNKLIIK